MFLMDWFIAASLAVLAQSSNVQPHIETEQHRTAAQQPTCLAHALDDQLALLQVKSTVKNREGPKYGDGGYIYDVNHEPVRVDAVYHAAVQIDLKNGRSLLVDMAPTAKVTKLLAEGGAKPDFGAKAYLMLDATHEASKMASCDPSKSYEGSGAEIAIEGAYLSGTLRDLAGWWKKNKQGWQPHSGEIGYNCQAFAREFLMEFAAAPSDMERATRALSHTPGLMRGGDGHHVAGMVAQGAGVFTDMFTHQLEDIDTDSDFNDVMDVSIVRARLWYETTENTYGTTSEATRAADYLQRRANLCYYELPWQSKEDFGKISAARKAKFNELKKTWHQAYNIEVAVRKKSSNGGKLGLSVHGPASNTGYSDKLIIDKLEGGMMGEWNQANPKEQVKVGDAILAINAATNEKEMIEAIGRDKVLEITVQTQAGP